MDTIGQGKDGGESAEMAIYDAEAKTFVPPVHSFGVGRRFAVAGLISWATASFRRRSVDKQLPVDRFRSLGFHFQILLHLLQ